MNRLWVQFSLAITITIIFAILFPTGIFLFGNWFNLFAPAQPEPAKFLALTPAESDRLATTLLEMLPPPYTVTIFTDGFFSIESISSPEQTYEMIQALLPDLSSKLNIVAVAAGGEQLSDPMPDPNGSTSLPQMFIDGRIPPEQIHDFADKFPAGEVVIMTEPFLVQNLSITDILQLFYEEVSEAIIISIVLGVGLGIWLSRTLTAPLLHLAEAATVIGDRELSYRVKVKGSKEVRELADTFNQMSVNLEQAERLQRQMMADVSHELRTPLTVLEGNLRAALDKVAYLDEQNLADLYSQTHHLIRLVNDLHEISQAETKQLSLTLKETDVAELVHQTVDVFAPLAEEKGLNLKCEVAVGLQPMRVDGSRLRQVLHNLLANAMRHTPSGGEITLTINQDAHATQISVADTGPGIAPEHLAHIFNRFYRTDDLRSRETGGTGLGLAIVKAIIEAHGGKVTAYSKGIGYGTTFTITLLRVL